jgi:hypothetical protein
MLRETVYNGYDNAIDVICKVSGSAVDVSGATKILLLDETDSVDLDSSVDSGVFTFTGLTYTGQIQMVLGGESIPDGTYIARLIVVDSTYTNGRVFGEIELEFVTP